MLCRIAQLDYVTAMSDAAQYLGTDGAQFQIGRLAVQGRAILAPVKMRLGWDAQSINAPELARLAEAKGIAMLSVPQRRIGERSARQNRRLPLTSPRMATARVLPTRCSPIWGGRGEDRPCSWFVGGAAYYLCHGKARATPPSAERKNAALEHFETLLEIYGTGRGLRHARKHLAAYAERGGSQNAADPA
jgi:tRNA-dihydrouridine synthase B